MYHQFNDDGLRADWDYLMRAHNLDDILIQWGREQTVADWLAELCQECGQRGITPWRSEA